MNLPESWALVPLENIAASEKGSIRRGPFGGSLKKSIFVESGFKVYEQQNAIKDDFQIGHYFIDEKKYREMEGFSVKPNDLIISCAGTIGRVAIAPETAEPGVINQALMRIRPNSEIVLCRYLKYLLESPKYQRDIFGKSAGSALKNLAAISEIKKCEIPLPPISEQRRIAAILDKADGVRRKRKEAISLTEELLRSVFLDMFGDPVTNPKGWETVCLSELINGDMRNGLSPSSKGNYPGNVLKLSAITQGIFDINEQKAAHFDVSPPKEKMVSESVFLTCRGNGNIKLVGCGRFPDQAFEDVMFPDTMIAIPINFSIIKRYFFEYIWNSPFVRHQIERQARTTNGTHKVNQKVLQKIGILLPPIDLQTKFTIIYSRAESLKKSFGLDRLDDLFNSLLQRAFHGEL